jgi:hypothetical protein
MAGCASDVGESALPLQSSRSSPDAGSVDVERQQTLAAPVVASDDASARLPRDSRGLFRRRIWPRSFGMQATERHARPDVLVVKFADGSAVRTRRGRLARATGSAWVDAERVTHVGADNRLVDRDVAAAERVADGRPRSEWIPLIAEEREAEEERRRVDRERRHGAEFEDLATVAFLSLPDATFAESARIAEQLREIPSVEYAYALPLGTAPQSTPRTAPACTDQLPGVTNVAPIAPSTYRQRHASGAAFVPNLTGMLLAGHDLEFARLVPGGNGDGVIFTDVEVGANWNHENLGPIDLFPFAWGDEHGTAVMSIAVGCNQSFGPPGIAPNAFARLSTVAFPLPPFYSTARGISDADERLPDTDVILVEQHLWDFSTSGCYACPTGGSCDGYVPAEYYPIEHATIRAAVGNGRVVVEAAGNAQRDLDVIPWLARFPWIDPQNSMALMVGGTGTNATIDGTSNSSCGLALSASNVGSRVDVSAWYGNVAAAGYGGLAGQPDPRFRFNTSNPGDVNQWYIGGFGGTSSASAIVAGAVTSLVGMYRAVNSVAPQPYHVNRYVAATGLPPGTGVASKVGPKLQLGIAASAFRDRVVGDGDDATAVTDVLSATPIHHSAGVNVILTGRRADGRYIHNTFRGGAWYGWTAFPLWNVSGPFGGSTLQGLDVRAIDEQGALVMEATAVDVLNRLVVSRASSIDPATSTPFGAWDVVPTSLTSTVASAVGVEFDQGFHDVFLTTVSGAIRWVYRQAGSTTFVGVPVSLPTSAVITSKLFAISPQPGRVEFFAIDSNQQLRHATLNGQVWNGWNVVPGGAGATMLDVVSLGDKIAVAAGWAGGNSVFFFDVPTSTWTAAAVDSVAPTAIEVSAAGSRFVRITTTDTSGQRGTRGVQITGTLSILPSPGRYLWTTSHPSGGITSSSWRSSLSIAFGVNADQRAVSRVIDQAFPQP